MKTEKTVTIISCDQCKVEIQNPYRWWRIGRDERLTFCTLKCGETYRTHRFPIHEYDRRRENQVMGNTD